MSYKTILTIISDADLSLSALETAIEVATQEQAHLEILCMGFDRTQTGYYYAGTNAMMMQETMARAQEDAKTVLDAVESRMKPEGIPWNAEAAVAQIAGISHIVAKHARFSDLVILPKPYGDNRGVEDEATLEAAMFNGKAPVLIENSGDMAPKRIVVAWNQSAEALTAIRAALPLLQKADTVNIAIIDPPQHGPDRSDPGGALSQMLSRHGVRPEISVLAKTMPRVSDVLRRHAQDVKADLIVMGAYGHSRFREAILGGATRSMLEAVDTPVFMAH